MRILFFLSSVVCCCFILSSLQGEIPMSSPCFREVEATTNKVARRLAKQFDMDWVGGGYLKLAFAIERRMDKAQARNLVTTCIQRALATLNANDFLKNCHPQGFNERDIRIEIYAQDGHGHRLYEPYVSAVSTSSGYVFFRYDIPVERYAYGYTDEEVLDVTCHSGLSVKPPVESPNPTELINILKKRYAFYGIELEGYGFSAENLALGLTLNRPIRAAQARRLALKVRAIAVEALSEDTTINTPPPNLDIAIYSYESKQTKFAPNWTRAPNIEFVFTKGDAITYSFMDENYKSHRINESYAIAEQLNAGDDIPDAVTAFATQVGAD